MHQRFEQEARSISRLQHPNICVVHDIGSQDGIDFMVMEYVAGQTVDKLIPPDGLATDLATKYAVQIAEALSRAHAVGVVHRDLKPSNIMVDESGMIKVLRLLDWRNWPSRLQQLLRQLQCQPWQR